jgi:type IV pilus assembly protein PilA
MGGEMQCPHCGTEVLEGNRFCPNCRKRVVAPSGGLEAGGSAPPPSAQPAGGLPPPPPGYAYAPPLRPIDMSRPGIVTLLAVLDILGGLFMILGAILVIVASVGESKSGDTAIAVVGGGACAFIGAVAIAAGVGMWMLQSWGRILQIVLACIGLLGFPCGTLINVLILIYLLKPGVKVLFSGRTATELSPQEAQDVAQLSTGSGATIVIVAVITVFVGIFMVGIIAAIAIPSLLRARVSANESAAIGNLRTLASAEVAYAQTWNSGFSDTPECLANPSSCVPGADSQPMFDSSSIQFDKPKTGYLLEFQPGQPAVAPEGARISPSSVSSFTITAVPATPGQTGVRSFCTDALGNVCWVGDGERFDVSDGTCGQCKPL